MLVDIGCIGRYNEAFFLRASEITFSILMLCQNWRKRQISEFGGIIEQTNGVLCGKLLFPPYKFQSQFQREAQNESRDKEFFHFFFQLSPVFVLIFRYNYIWKQCNSNRWSRIDRYWFPSRFLYWIWFYCCRHCGHLFRISCFHYPLPSTPKKLFFRFPILGSFFRQQPFLLFLVFFYPWQKCVGTHQRSCDEIGIELVPVPQSKRPKVAKKFTLSRDSDWGGESYKNCNHRFVFCFFFLSFFCNKFLKFRSFL